MKEVTIERFGYLPFGTFGKLVSEDDQFQCYTVEKAWANNEPFISCIPEGKYLCEKRKSPSRGEVYEILDVLNRDHILIHAGNWPENFMGCIGLGSGLSVMNNAQAVQHSRKTVKRFNNYIYDDQFKLIIKQYDPMKIYNNVGALK